MLRKNKWRRAGRFEFRRESGRYSDGTPDGRDVLFVRIKGVACCYASTPYPESEGLSARIYYNDGLYFTGSPIKAAHKFRAAMLRKLA
jgi:hypothetical protein